MFVLHGRDGARRYALIDTGWDWLLHLTKDQPSVTDSRDAVNRCFLAEISPKASVSPGKR